ncbi:MAG: DUF1415 domain-containing protein, partial [Bacteroidota bacterium]
EGTENRRETKQYHGIINPAIFPFDSLRHFDASCEISIPSFSVSSAMNADKVLLHTRRWIESVVIGHQVCPFAGSVFRDHRIRYRVSVTKRPEDLWQEWLAELVYLQEANRVETETTLIIHPQVLTDFEAYCDFVAEAEEGLEELDFASDIQLAGFHPAYQFEGSPEDDPANYTNRSPYPMLHLLRVESVSEAVDSYPGVDDIPDRNITRFRALGKEQAHALWQAAFGTDFTV